MESTSPNYISPSFSIHSFNNISNVADRVVDEFLAENGLDSEHVFSFSDDDNPTNIAHDIDVNSSSCNRTINKHQEEESIKEDTEQEFEFSVAFSDLNLSLATTDNEVAGDQITSYPLFDRSLLSDLDLCLCNSSINHMETNTEPTSVPGQDTVPSPAPAPAPAPAPTPTFISEIVPATDEASTSASSPSPRRSLRNLFIEDRDSASTSSSEADDLEGITPETYCVWKPEIFPRGKHKKSNSISIGGISKRWNVRDLLKRSYSDDSYGKDPSVPLFSPLVSNNMKTIDGDSPPEVLILPPISPRRKRYTKKVKNIEKKSKVNGATTGVPAPADKTEPKVPAYRTKIGNIRLPPYLPYREDQLPAFANYNGSNKHMYRYKNV